MELDAMTLVFWMLSFKPAFSLSSFTFIKRLFSSSLLSSIRVVSSAYLRLLTFLPAILAPACDSPSLTFHMMYPACKLNKQDDNKKPWWTPFPMLNQSVFLCPVLTVASQETGKVVWYFHLFKNFPQFVVIHIVKGFSIVNETEVDVFLEFLWFFYDPMDVGNWSLVPLPFLDSISRSSQFMYYWSLAWRILSINLLACEVSTIVQ